MFNIRVYGILISDQQVLLSDERINGKEYTKFPGGGLELGEGTRDCLKREFKEEMNLDIEVGPHLYTTDFYQQSAFNPAHQIISIYYFVNPLEDFVNSRIKVHEKQSEIATVRFVDLNRFSENDVTLPIDKIVAKLLNEKFVQGR